MNQRVIDPTQFIDDLQGKNINFLIGAGASAGLVRTLNISLPNESFEDFYSSDDITPEQRTVLDFIWFQLWIKDTLVDEEKMKELKEKGDNKSDVIKNYYEFVNNLASLLDAEGYDKPKRANIFTTNYDSLFELVFDEISKKNRLIYFNDGSRGFFNRYISTENFNLNVSHSAVTDNFQRSIPTINLLKIHGSITWTKSKDDKIKVSMNSDTFNNLVELGNKLSNRIDEHSSIYKVFFDHDQNVDNNIREKLLNELLEFYKANQDEFENFILKYHNLQVVNPTKEKFRETVFQQNYYQMIRMLSFELEKKNSVLIVFGFSFADEHIREIVKRSIINPSLKVFVICYDASTREKISSMFQDVPTDNIEYLPYSFEKNQDGQDLEIHGNFDYLNFLFGDISNG